MVVLMVEEENKESILASVAVVVEVVLVVVEVLPVLVVLRVESTRILSISGCRTWKVIVLNPVSVEAVVVVVSVVRGLYERVRNDVKKLVADVLLVRVVKINMELVDVDVGTFDLPTVLVLMISLLNLLVSVTVPKLVANSPTNLVMLVVTVFETGTMTR